MRNLLDLFEGLSRENMVGMGSHRGSKEPCLLLSTKVELLEAGKNSQRHRADGLIGRTRVVAGSARTHAWCFLTTKRLRSGADRNGCNVVPFKPLSSIELLKT